MMTKQGVAIGTADDMWKFLAKGDFTVSADVKAQAQADIADDGYWGVEQTSDRILDFAKALSGDDPDKADAMLEAFKKGFEQATKAWGDKRSCICTEPGVYTSGYFPENLRRSCREIQQMEKRNRGCFH